MISRAIQGSLRRLDRAACGALAGEGQHGALAGSGVLWANMELRESCKKCNHHFHHIERQPGPGYLTEQFLNDFPENLKNTK